MKRVTRNNLIKLVDMMKEYQETESENLKIIINDFIENAINKDKHYFKKLGSYNFENEILRYLI